MIHFIQTYIWGGIGQGAPVPVHALDSKLRKCHSSFVACLLALGRAQWPELKRGLGKETLEELEVFYEELKRETASLQHIKIDTVIVIDHLGRSLPVPMIFCISPQDFHVVITGFCRDLAGDVLVQRGNYRIFNSEDDQVINPEEFYIVLQPGMAVDMSIVFHEQAKERQGSEGYNCPRCKHINSRCTGWVTCANCNASFNISPEEESIVSPEVEQHAGTDSIPDERYLFRKISIFQASAPNMGILLNRETSKKSKIQPGELGADAETKQITEAQDDAQDVTARPSFVQPPNSRIPRTQSDNSQAASGLTSGEGGSVDESQDSQAAPGSLADLADLENSIANWQQALALIPDGHPSKPGLLTNLGSGYGMRFDRLGDLADLQNSVASLEYAIALTPDGHPQKASHLANLGNSYGTRFDRLGDLADLENSVASLEHAVALTADGHPQKAGLLANLGSGYGTRYERFGDLADLENSMVILQQAVSFTPDGHPQKADHLANLGGGYGTRFDRLGNLADLENSVASLQQAVALTPDGHPHKASHLTNLGSGYGRRFDRLGDLADLKNSIANRQQALALTPDGHPQKARPSHKPR
ncbi:hypothetical protein FIBSPDRAFT_813169 [Athelia psychrophila]|uniref:Ubiquitin-like domain-containing protein n=1 Tax=Athelia psychrophila TaxID=1759441 RepID=A0A166UFJ2_9AGAM|nr:hypothetical protein FIBSPDRAFT_813169 [Fibularhizoctonia sp. CBS 109695]